MTNQTTGDAEESDRDTQTERPEEEQDTGFGQEIVLADDGDAHHSIVISESTSDSFREEAEEIATYLSDISGADFSVQTGDGSEGIVLGVPEDFDALPIEIRFSDGVLDRDQYIVRSTADGIYLLGATPTAARFAGWDLLREFGYRYYFPSDTWEVVPEHDRLEIAVDRHETPDWKTRQGPRGMTFASWGQDHLELHDSWADWKIRNRTESQFELRTSHSWANIYQRNREAFHENPEWLAGEITPEELDDSLEDDPRHPMSGVKFDLTHEDLRALIVEDRIARLEEMGGHSISIDPSDSDGWCRTERCLEEIGGPSEQLALLANEVAEGIVEEFGDQYFVGHYAYNFHGSPPKRELHDNVIPSLATRYLRSGVQFGEMLEGWGVQANMIGIREYYGDSVLWPQLPTFNPAAKREYIAESIRYYFNNGARFMNAQANNHWGGNGVGYWLSSRFLWDVSETVNAEELFTEFLKKCFRAAREPMREFYELIDGNYETIPPQDDFKSGLENPMAQLPDDLVGKMYNQLALALENADDDPEVTERLHDLILYTRYVELYLELDESPGQEAFEELVTFTWRIRKRAMVNPLALQALDLQLNYVDEYDELEWPGGEPPDDSEAPPDPLRENEDDPYREAQILEILEKGLKAGR